MVKILVLVRILSMIFNKGSIGISLILADIAELWRIVSWALSKILTNSKKRWHRVVKHFHVSYTWLTLPLAINSIPINMKISSALYAAENIYYNAVNVSYSAVMPHPFYCVQEEWLISIFEKIMLTVPYFLF